MAKVYAPNKKYNGISYGVQFMNGEGETEDKWLLQLFKENGYKVEEFQEQDSQEDKTEDNDIDLTKLEAKELKEIADERGIKYAKNASQEQMLELLKGE